MCLESSKIARSNGGPGPLSLPPRLLEWTEGSFNCPPICRSKRTEKGKKMRKNTRHENRRRGYFAPESTKRRPHRRHLRSSHRHHARVFRSEEFSRVPRLCQDRPPKGWPRLEGTHATAPRKDAELFRMGIASAVATLKRKVGTSCTLLSRAAKKNYKRSEIEPEVRRRITKRFNLTQRGRHAFRSGGSMGLV
jgi:hypothetical protein